MIGAWRRLGRGGLVGVIALFLGALALSACGKVASGQIVQKAVEPAQRGDRGAVRSCRRYGYCRDWDPYTYYESERLRFRLRDASGREGDVYVDRFTFASYAIGDT